MFRLACLLALSATTVGLSQSPTPTEQEREKDVYAIYSWLLISYAGDGNPRYLIEETTGLASRWGKPCVQPPKDRTAEFQEVLSDLESRKNKPRTLKRQFSIAKPYELLDAVAATAFMNSRRKPGAQSSADIRFDGVFRLVTFSDAYFSDNGKLALTSLAVWCGRVCGQHRWRVLEKLPTGQWRELRSWVTCETISDGRPHRASRPA